MPVSHRGSRVPARRCAALLAVGGVTLVALLAAATSAQAATVTVTGDDGNPRQLIAGQATAIRHLSPSVSVSFPATTGRFSFAVTAPDGVTVMTPVSCLGVMQSTRMIGYRGNGTYTVRIVNFGNGDANCSSPLSTEIYTFSINAGVPLPQPSGRFLIRQPDRFTTRTLEMPIGLNPGAFSYEVRYARNARIGSDGAIVGPSQQASVSTSAGQAMLRFTRPGTYTVVARTSGSSGGTRFFTPWSAPVRIRTVAPFDFSSITFPDARGPSYQLRGTLRERSIRGRVAIAIAKGSSRRWRSLGQARISRRGTISKRFRVDAPGSYRLRYSFRGSSIAAGGRVVQRIRITRSVFFG